MVKIQITDLDHLAKQPFIIDINELENMHILGGANQNFSALFNFAIKSMEFVLIAYAIDAISRLVTSFSERY
ncbi:MAG: hypothetical protein EAZ87_09580 [Nostocales cyanobacterium]|nr:MAG: hypothetical protein EAZ87_09580 [Nostocales cyanobacterium]